MGKLGGFKEFERRDFETRPVKDRVKDYREVHTALPAEDMEKQAARCMNCGTPFCNWGCPLGNLIPDWNDLAYRGDWKKAYERIRMTNNFPEFTGRICPALCESSCTLGINYNPVSIRELEFMIIEKAFKEGWVKPVLPRNRTGKKVAVVGSGPSGLSTAAQLNSVGHEVVVFERHEEAGGLLRYGIPDFKLEKNIVKRRIKIMKEEGIEFRTGVNVGVDITSKQLKDEFDAVVLTGGSTIPRDLDAQGRQLEGIYFAVDYLSAQNRAASDTSGSKKNVTAKGKSVVVIGGGDTGSDCIGTAIRQGAKKVCQIEIMPKPPVSRDETMPWPLYPKILKTTTSHEEGCERMWNISTKSFEGKDGKLTRLNCTEVKWSKNGGRMSMEDVSGSEFYIDADIVLIAMGFLHPDHNGLLNDLSVEFDKRGNVLTSDSHMTNVEGVFSAGDMRTGQSLVVRAIEDGRITARYVDEYLMGDSFL